MNRIPIVNATIWPSVISVKKFDELSLSEAVSWVLLFWLWYVMLYWYVTYVELSSWEVSVFEDERLNCCVILGL